MLETFSSPDDFLLNRHISPINSSLASYLYCFITKPSSLIYTTLMIIGMSVLFPLCIFILYHGVQEWQKRRSTSSAASMSHCDCFTYHMVVMELMGVFGCLICCCGIYREDFDIIHVAFPLLDLNYYGQVLFHVLTCVERYLAVMHPITYLSLKQERGVRIRNVIIGCVWLICFIVMGLLQNYDFSIFFSICIMTLSLAAICFCSLFVLCALIRPGPGEQSWDRKKIDPSKQRAFYTILVILVTLLLRFACGLVWTGNFASGEHSNCVMMTIDFWFYLPSSLVLPLLLLHRAGKLKCWQKNTKQ